MVEFRVPEMGSFSWQLPVLDILTAPPGGESEGDRYLVGTSDTGDFSGHNNEIAWYDGAAYQFDTPAAGWSVYVVDEDNFYKFDGSVWDASLSDINDLDDVPDGSVYGRVKNP